LNNSCSDPSRQIKKIAKVAPGPFLVKVLRPERVRPVKISTAGKDEPSTHLPQEGGGRIFTDSTLTSPVPGACKQSFFIFLSFFGFFFLFLFSGNNHKRGAVRWSDAFPFAILIL